MNDPAFLDAFNHCMLYEVGPFWDPTDPEVQAGAISTPQQRKKVGYVNIPADHGGETKFGIARNANPNVNISALNLQGAQDIYFNVYWLGSACDQLPFPLTIFQFDSAVNHGVGRACKFLQTACGVDADGNVGMITLSAVANTDQKQLIEKMSQARSDFYNSIVRRDPSQGVFLKGWMKRLNDVTAFSLSKLS